MPNALEFWIYLKNGISLKGREQCCRFNPLLVMNRRNKTDSAIFVCLLYFSIYLLTDNPLNFDTLKPHFYTVKLGFT